MNTDPAATPWLLIILLAVLILLAVVVAAILLIKLFSRRKGTPTITSEPNAVTSSPASSDPAAPAGPSDPDADEQTPAAEPESAATGVPGTRPGDAEDLRVETEGPGGTDEADGRGQHPQAPGSGTSRHRADPVDFSARDKAAAQGPTDPGHGRRAARPVAPPPEAAEVSDASTPEQGDAGSVPGSMDAAETGSGNADTAEADAVEAETAGPGPGDTDDAGTVAEDEDGTEPRPQDEER